MNPTTTGTNTLTEQAFFLSQILGTKVIVGGRKIGKLQDLIIKENGSVPVVTHLFISLPWGESATVPWDRVASLGPKEITLNVDNIAAFRGEPDEGAVLLRDHILDKKAIDLEGREMEVVYDVKLILRNHTLYASEVDLSRYGLLRRMGLTRLAEFIYTLADKIREQTISWSYIQRLPEDLGRFRGDVRFKVLREKLSDMHPVDLADILEEMDHDQRVQVFDSLEPEHASDTLEEIEPSVQRDLVSALKVEKVAQLIGDMTTAQAADILSILSASEADDILALLDLEDAHKIQAIMQEHEASILNSATQEYLAFSPGWTAEQAQDLYREAARGKDVVMYLYIVDDSGRLVGVLDIKELLQAEDRARLGDVMVTNVVTLDPGSTLREATELFARYDFRALPITDQDDRILGVVMHRDVMGLKHRFVE